MSQQLSADCLNEIFKYLDDKVDLYSCLLVDRLWCEVSVRILWKIIRNYNTLIICLPNESKEVLYKNGFILSTSTSKPPLFNYVTFIKKISISEIYRHINKLHSQNIDSQRFDSNKIQEISVMVTQEILKMLMNQTCLKILDFGVGFFLSSFKTCLSSPILEQSIV